MSRIVIKPIVTTYPYENMDLNNVLSPIINTYLPSPDPTVSVKLDPIGYYRSKIKTVPPDINDGTLTIDQITQIKANTSATYLDKTRYLLYNAICDKLFENNLNYLNKIAKDSVFIFPTFNELNKGKDLLNPLFFDFYDDKFDLIKTDIDISNTNAWLELKVFSNNDESKEEYTSRIKNNFDEIGNTINSYNDAIQQKKLRAQTIINHPVKNIYFILDTDKKSLFTGMYNKILSKEKKDILYSEYTKFCSSSKYIKEPDKDSSLSVTSTSIIREIKNFKVRTGINLNQITKVQFDEIIAELNEKYKQQTNKEYKKSLSIPDNIKKLLIYYRINNIDKIIDDKIKTGTKILYKLSYSNVKSDFYIGYFSIKSLQLNTYKFTCDKRETDRERNRINKLNKKNSSNEPTDSTDSNGNNYGEEEKEEEKEETVDVTYPTIIVKVDYKFGQIYYQSLTDKKKGLIVEVLNKNLNEKYKWFKLKDMDASLEAKNEIKYYEDILYDKESLIAFLKEKKRYNEKTNISYEFLKINDSLELSEYCDFIHSNFKKNIIERNDFNIFNPFKRTFTVNDIHKNILGIIFQSNNTIYIQNIAKTNAPKTSSTKDNYKIIDYKIFPYSEEYFIKEEKYCAIRAKKEQCSVEIKAKLNKITHKDPTDDDIKSLLKVVVINITKENIEDIEELKKKGQCKTKKNKLVYRYKKLFGNITRKVAPLFIDPYKGGKLKTRRLKTTRYK